MAEPIKSVLLVDFESLHRSLTSGGGEAAARLVMKVPGWIAGLQSGRLLGPHERSFLVKRCYADPKTIGEGRSSFTSAGFRMVDCAATSAGRGVDLMMAMDCMEHLNDEETVDEFVLLSSEPTLAPLLTRLKHASRRTAIYADTHTGQGYRALADAVLDNAAFAEFLLTHDAPDSASALVVDRSEIEGFARKIHAATNIPLFSPRTFAELFRLLTEEIIANGYHFQTTAKNVADKLSESGRSVTRRQVVFIVKGLALKGHVFSTTDSPKKLAEVFREQAVYLIDSAGLKLDEAQERILSAWLVDRVPTTIGRPMPTGIPPMARPQPEMPPAAAPSLNGTRAALEEPDAAAPVPATAKPGAPPAPRKVEPARPAAAKSGETPAEKPTASAPAERSAPLPPPAAERPPQVPAARAPGSMISPDDARAAIAAKIAQSVRPKPAARPAGAPASAAPGGKAPPPVSPSTASPSLPTAGSGEPGSIESSILAAIAEAVDVLVEDGEPHNTAEAEAVAPPPAPAARNTKRPAAQPQPAAARPAVDKRPPQRAEPPQPRADKSRQEAPRQGGEDIGDEIQRIIATYNRNRKDEPPTQE